MRSVGTGRAVATVILVALDHEAMGLVRETLAAEAVLPASSLSYGEALGAVKRSRPDVLVVGMDQAMDSALALAQALTREAPNTTLVALAAESSAETILSAMRVGYKEFVVLPTDANRLRQVVHEAAYSGAADDEKGLVVSVCGAKGGVGATIICTHLAAELAAIHRVLCLDLDFSMGDVATMMDVTPKDTILDVLPRADRMDERALTGSVAVHRSKVHVLPQPTDIDKFEEPNPDDLYAIINNAATAYQYVLVDVGVRTDDTAELALTCSDIIMLITTPDVIAVRDAFRRMKTMEKLGVEKERIKLVVNKYRRGTFVSLDDIQNNLQIEVSATVADDEKTVDSAINEGKLIREVNRKSDVARDISTMVAMVTDDFDEDEDDEPSGNKGPGFFSSLFGRG